MNKIEKFTSTGNKLMHNPEWLSRVIDKQQIMPLSIECAPESRCNLRCSYCSNKDRKTDETLSADFLLPILEGMRALGTKTIQWTGGGEFLIHPEANTLIKECHKMGYQMGMITNGTMFQNLEKEALDKLTWIRVSLNIEAMSRIKIPEVSARTTLGFSFVATDHFEEYMAGEFKMINDFVLKHNPAYVRIVPNCLEDDVTQVANNIKYSKIVKGWGSPYFYQTKEFRRPDKCWWSLAKPFLLHDGFYYPCSSVVLNPDSENHFNEKYRVGKIEALVDNYLIQSDFPPEPFDSSSCSHCVFYKQNQLVNSLMNPSNMKDFV